MRLNGSQFTRMECCLVGQTKFQSGIRNTYDKTIWFDRIGGQAQEIGKSITRYAEEFSVDKMNKYLDTVHESQGNQVFADLLPNLISVIENPGMLIIDEFGNDFHNKLSENIIRFFWRVLRTHKSLLHHIILI